MRLDTSSLDSSAETHSSEKGGLLGPSPEKFGSAFPPASLSSCESRSTSERTES